MEKNYDEVMEEILNCKFCGGLPKLYLYEESAFEIDIATGEPNVSKEKRFIRNYTVDCCKCSEHYDGETMEEAILKWNCVMKYYFEEKK